MPDPTPPSPPIPRRTEIRAALAAALRGLATTGQNVFESRTRALSSGELPAILVFSGDQSAELWSLSSSKPRVLRWRLRADVLVKESDGAEGVADRILGEMFAVLYASPSAMTLGGKIMSLSAPIVGEVDLDDSCEKPAVRVPVAFDLTFSEAA